VFISIGGINEEIRIIGQFNFKMFLQKKVKPIIMRLEAYPKVRKS
jgi:hypothetical protein